MGRILTDFFIYFFVLKHEELGKRLIGAYYEIYNELGFGFLEKVYENAFILVLQEKGIHGLRQVPIKVQFRNSCIGNYFADIIVEDVIIIELKATEQLCEDHEIQLVNYLKATNIEVGYLFNFGKKPEFRRKIFENHLKHQSKSVSSV